MYKLRTNVILFAFCFWSIDPLVGQIEKFAHSEVEYGIRVLRTSQFIRREVSVFEEDYGVQFFDGFFARILRPKISGRLGIGFYSSIQANEMFKLSDKVRFKTNECSLV